MNWTDILIVIDIVIIWDFLKELVRGYAKWKVKKEES